MRFGGPKRGAAADPEFLLCEIDTSCVSPFPDGAITLLMVELERRLASSPPSLRK